MIEHVNEVLADPGKYHPAYNEADGYEIEGFVWFQGWNDLVGPYPSKGKTKDYSEYSRLLATFIRDVRVDLEVPELPFVIGVIGVDGELEPGDKQSLFREAMAAPASMDAFKDNVVAEATAPYWDMKLQQVLDKREQGMRQLVIAEHPELESRPRALSNEVGRNREELLPKVLTPEEIEFVQMAQSNASFHYNGSAYTYGLIGKAFAEALVELKK